MSFCLKIRYPDKYETINPKNNTQDIELNSLNPDNASSRNEQEVVKHEMNIASSVCSEVVTIFFLAVLFESLNIE